MDFNNKFDFVWGNNDGTEPSDNLKENGFTGGYKPPASVFNWFWRKTMKIVNELQDALTTVDNKIPTKISDLPNDSGYIDSVIDSLESTSAKSALSANQGNVLSKKTGKSLAGEKVYSSLNNYVTCNEGAEIYNDYSARTYTAGGVAEQGNIASGWYAHAEGWCTTASGQKAHAEGSNTIASGDCTHAEGYGNSAAGIYSHAEGANNTATGYYSHVGGRDSQTLQACAFAHGRGTTANHYQTVFGAFNIDTAGYTSLDGVTTAGTRGENLFIIGNGSSDSVRSNAFRVKTDGQSYGLKAFLSSGADFAEYFEWFDGNPDNEDRRGRIVTLDGDKIRLANSDDNYILGIVTNSGAFIGNSASEEWQGRYLKDVFGEILTQDVELPETTDEVTGKVIPARTVKRNVVNPDYNPEQEYISREYRKEWSPIGMLGQVIVVDDGTCQVNGYCRPSENGIGTAAENGYRVMSRIDDTHIKVLVK